MQRSFSRIVPALALTTLIGFSGCNPTEDATPVSENNRTLTKRSEVKGTSYIVCLKDEFAGPSAAGHLHSVIARNKLNNKLHHIITGKAFNGFVIQLTADELAILSAEPSIKNIEPDGEVTICDETLSDTVVTPPSYTIVPQAGQNISWGANTVGVGDGAATGRAAWIVDSGIQLSHPDLNVDAVRSRSFINGTISSDDQFGHGTQVAGILAAKDNNFGVVGIAAGATLVSCRVLGATGTGTASSVLNALNYIAANAQPGDVANLSIGYSANTIIDNAVINVANLGIYVTIAAGNSSANCALTSPARVNHSNVFTVSGMRPDGTFMGMSNWGTPVDFCAPGTQLASTKIGSAYTSTAGGTSMAAPHVAGILLVRGSSSIPVQGFVIGDPDGNPDPIPHM